MTETATRLFRDESVAAPRAAGVNLLNDATMTSMPQIHLGERLQVYPAMPEQMLDLVMDDALKHGITKFSPYASDVTAIEFGHPEHAKKLKLSPPRRLFLDKYGLIPFPPAPTYRRKETRLPTPLHKIVENAGNQASVSIPQCVLNALAHHLRCVDLLLQAQEEALIDVA